MCAFAIFVMLIGVIFNTSWQTGNEYVSEGSVSLIGRMLLTEYLLPFEIASILLLAALMGAALLSRKT